MQDDSKASDEAALPRVRRIVFLALAVPVLLIAVLFALLAWQLRVVAEQDRWVAHTYEVIAGAWRLNKLLIDHESGLRAYILTRDETFLEPYRAARAEIPQAFDQVEAMVRDSPAEQLRIDHLRSRYVQWLRSAEEAINGAGQRDIRALPDFLETMRARKAQMDGMREATQQILSEEGRLLHERQGRSEATEARLFWGGGFIALALAVVATFLLRRVIGILEASYLQAYRAQAESARKADEANRAKDDFLAILSHELRTPLNAIAGWSHILIGEGVDRTTVRKGAEIINRNAMAQTQLISDILDVSRIITGKLRLNVGAADLATVVERALEAVTVAAAAKDIRIESVLDPMSPVSCDADRLQQVVWNLLANAIKFTPKGGRVQVRVERVSSSVQIEVGDNGPGVSPDLLPHVFERFRQGDTTAARAHGGLGLGLAIVRHLTELHGGTVTAANRVGGSGALFTVRLPLRLVAVAPDPQTRPSRSSTADRASPGVSLHGIRVLAVDDELDARELIREVLARSGAQVSVASTAKEGLSALVAERPDVVIADVAMPGEDGYAFMANVRALPMDAGGATPALALTAFASAEDRMKALRAGFQMHIAKPVDPSELVTVVRDLSGGTAPGPPRP